MIKERMTPGNSVNHMLQTKLVWAKMREWSGPQMRYRNCGKINGNAVKEEDEQIMNVRQRQKHI